jgi:hypothetical protein
MDVPAMIKSDPDADALVVAALAATDIHDALTSKYGRAIEQIGVCRQASVQYLMRAGSARCESKWKGPAQLILLEWSYYHRTGTFLYSLKYRAEATGL